jgi:hypothetical protein
MRIERQLAFQSALRISRKTSLYQSLLAALFDSIERRVDSIERRLN